MQETVLAIKKHWWNIGIILIALAVSLLRPKLCYLAMYWEGRADITDGIGIWGKYTILIIPLMAIFVCVAIICSRISGRFLIGIFAAFTYLVVSWVFVPFYPKEAGATVFMRGFQDGVKERVSAEQLQAWASDLLDRYDKGELALPEESASIGLGVKVPDSEVPEFVKNMWARTPWRISIRSPGEKENETHVVEISWRLHGVLVGRPDYEMYVDPYGGKWTPGIYFFHRVR